MTYPDSTNNDFSTEELVALYNQITPGTWYATDENEGSDLMIDETSVSLLSIQDTGAGDVAMFHNVADGKAAALAPWALAEVIRYRKQEGK